LEDVVVDWLVAAESLGCDLETKRLFAELCGDQGIRIVWHEGPPDLGDCLNLMISRVETELLMYIQDDWELHTQLDLVETPAAFFALAACVRSRPRPRRNTRMSRHGGCVSIALPEEFEDLVNQLGIEQIESVVLREKRNQERIEELNSIEIVPDDDDEDEDPCGYPSMDAKPLPTAEAKQGPTAEPKYR